VTVLLGQRAEKDDHIATVLKKPSGLQVQQEIVKLRPKDAQQLRKSRPVLGLEFKTTMSLDSAIRPLIRTMISIQTIVTLRSIRTRLPREIRPSVRVDPKGAVAEDDVLKPAEVIVTRKLLILETQRTNGTTMIQVTS